MILVSQFSTIKYQPRASIQNITSRDQFYDLGADWSWVKAEEECLNNGKEMLEVGGGRLLSSDNP